MMRALIVIALCVGQTAAARGQQTDSLSLSHPELLERSYLFKNFPSSKTGEYFEGILPVHIPFRQNLQGAFDQVLAKDWKSHHTLSGIFSMVVNLRMTRENSAPVRTPSYMPKVTFTYFNVKRSEAATLPTGLPRSVRMWIVPFVPYGHYSNGQDGCLFTFQQEIAQLCRDTSTVAHDTSAANVNRRDGSFSSHYMQLGVFYRRIALDTLLPSGNYVSSRFYWSFGGQVRAYQPYYWLGGGLSEELRRLYGPTRVRVLANRVIQRRDGRYFGPGQFRVEGWVEGILGTRTQDVDPVRLSLEIARTMDKRSGWGLFIRAYSGQDDYNLGFMQNIRVVQLGVTATNERLPYFKL
jgi:hypothetical protein